MNALNESARIVDTSWCKGDLRKESDAKDKGDTYCAVGAMIHAFSTSNMLDIDWGFEAVGPKDSLDSYQAAHEQAMASRQRYFNDEIKSEDMIQSPMFSEHGLKNMYVWIGTTPEGALLAETIVANYPDRTGLTYDEFMERAKIEEGDDLGEFLSDVIVQFNDHDDTTREDVVAMMEKAAVSLEDKVAFEDKTSDDLVSEIDELLNA